MSESDKKEASPFDESPNGGRHLLLGVFVASVALLAMLRWQTVPGSMGQTAMSGGWWAEPALAPSIVLGITALSSLAAFYVSIREKFDWQSVLSTYARVALIAGFMICAVMLMKVIGFALSILVFAGVVGFIAGYRGVKLAAIAFGTSIVLVLIFRVGFSIWFPRPSLFKLIDMPFWLQGIL